MLFLTVQGGSSSLEEEELGLFQEYKRNPGTRLEELLLKRFEKLVYSIMRSFNISSGELDDIRQVGMAGLLLAIRRYDPASGNRFSTFAFPTIRGEIQRHFRDKRWAVNVPRKLKEMSHKVFTTQALLSAKLGQEPTVKDLASETGLSEEEVIEAMELGSAYSPKSFHENPSDDEYGQYVTSEQVVTAEAGELERDMFWSQLFKHISKVEAEVLRLRFLVGLTQKEVADKLETSQMCISRIQRTALAKLREVAGDYESEL